MRLFKSLKNPKKTDAKLPKKSSGLNNRAAIGIDIDQHSIKMVQLSGRSLNQIQLEKYVIAKLPKNIIQGNKVQNYDQLVTYLQQAYAKLGTSCKNIIASVPQNLATIEQLTYTDKDAELDLQGFVESSILRSQLDIARRSQLRLSGLVPIGRRRSCVGRRIEKG